MTGIDCYSIFFYRLVTKSCKGVSFQVTLFKSAEDDMSQVQQTDCGPSDSAIHRFAAYDEVTNDEKVELYFYCTYLSPTPT